MSRLHARPTLALLAALLSLPSIAAASTPQEMLAALCRADGGARWRDVAYVVADARLHGNGLDGQQHDVTDLRDGRQRSERRFAVFAEAGGIDADGAWRQDRSGQVHPLDSPEAGRLAATDRWLARRGYCDTAGPPATLVALPPASADGVAYDRIDATPPHGRTVTLWIDRAHHRLARTVMLRSFQTVTERFDDYRQVHGLALPFRIRTDVGDPAQADVETVTAYRLPAALPAHALARPGDAVTDARILGGRASATVPLSISNTKLLVNVRLDGQGPFPMALDTGGHAILTPATARRLGLTASGAGRSFGAGSGSTALGYTRVARLQLGDAEIDDQSFLVMPMASVLTDRGTQPPVAGLIGLELFERFAVALDFARKRMTLQPFGAAAPPGATAVPIRFTDDMPLVQATLDGQPGLFGIDTGNTGPLMLFPRWAGRHGLATYYMAGMPTPEGGVGGMFTAHAAYIRSLRIGGLDIPADQPGFLTPPGTGSTSNPSEAGNLGLPVWRHFRIGFDYRRERMYLAPRPGFSLPQATASAGLGAIKLDPAAFTVLQVLPGGPAARAGLKQGDRIVAVDGTPASHLEALWLVEHTAHGRPGKHLHLACADGRRIDLVLGSNAAMEKALRPSVH
jgi:hypothetical protein